jgi:hypothetical protein
VQLLRTLNLTAIVLTLECALASAQPQRPPIELGVGISGLAAVPYEDFGVPEQSPAAEVRVTIPLSPRFSIEGQTSLSPHRHELGSGIDGFYSIQIKQRLVSGTRGRFHPFLTYGSLGFYEHERIRPYSTTAPNGSTTTYPGYSYSSLDGPYGLVLGGGVQYELGAHAAWRTEAQMISFLWIPLGVRFSTGISIPLRSY